MPKASESQVRRFGISLGMNIMNNKHARDEAVENKYSVYAAGGIFTQHDLTTNVLIKDSVWKQSKGKFELVLPQSKELRDIDRPDIAAYIRNVDLFQV